MTAVALPGWRSVLAVCAHPDDESFGLGAVLAAFAGAGTSLGLVCFTRGEASTLHGPEVDLAAARFGELEAASDRLGVERVELLDHPDGALASEPFDELVRHVVGTARWVRAGGLLVFDDGGITGHPDHQRATDAALAAAEHLDLPVLAWALPVDVAETLNRGLGTGFVGRSPNELDILLEVDRAVQLAAIECHRSQSRDNPVLRRRLQLQGDTEWLRYLRRPGDSSTAS